MSETVSTILILCIWGLVAVWLLIWETVYTAKQAKIRHHGYEEDTEHRLRILVCCTWPLALGIGLLLLLSWPFFEGINWIRDKLWAKFGPADG